MFDNDPLLVESSYLIAFILEESFKGLKLLLKEEQKIILYVKLCNP